MQVKVSDSVREFIDAHDTMSLASTTKGQPWTTPLFYQVDSDLRFYFISDADTRHIQNTSLNHCVALSIFDQKQAWQEIQGVQIEGHIDKVDDENRGPVEALYCEKFPFISSFLQATDSENARRVKERFLASDFYVVTPHFVRFIDNKRGFGFKEEYYLSLV